MHATDLTLFRVHSNVDMRPTPIALALCPTQTSGNPRHVFFDGLLRRLALSLHVCLSLCSSGLASFIFLVFAFALLAAAKKCSATMGPLPRPC